jgi:adenosylmethionine-8-amino-7-oxononanoate aminotransferase
MVTRMESVMVKAILTWLLENLVESVVFHDVYFDHDAYWMFQREWDDEHGVALVYDEVVVQLAVVA